MAPNYRADRPAKGYRGVAPVNGMTGIHIGIVKDNTDPQRMGRLKVWIPEFGGNPLDPINWFSVSYASPFAGVTPVSSLRKDGEDMESSSMSYGWWSVPPDIDNQVLVCFTNGDLSHGFWFACVYQQNMNHMVPGLASATPTDPDSVHCGVEPPTVEYNRWSDQNPNAPKRPVFKPLDEGLSNQGLYPDPERGTSTTSARREAPSQAYGYITPRGNTIHIDDNPKNEFIRLRTHSGVQILVHDTTGYVYINSASGNSWFEVSDIGIDGYSMGSVSFRSQGSLNLVADASLNIESGGNMNFRAGGNITMASAINLDIAANGHVVVNSGGVLSAVAAGDVGITAGAGIGLQASGAIFQGSGGDNIRSAAIIQDNTGASGSAVALTAKLAATNDLPEVIGEAPCFEATTRATIAKRMPTHEPYVGHPDADSGAPIVAADEFPTAEETAAQQESGGTAADVSNITATDIDWLAVCIYDEASTQIDDGKAAVAQVIKNRMSRHFQSDGTIKGTVLKKDQFSGFYFDFVNGKYTRVCGDLASAEKRGLAKMKRYQANKTLWARCKDIGQKVMNGTYSGAAGFQLVRSNKNAVMYCNTSISKPAWAVKSKLVAKIDDHTFFIS